ncbi:mitochondrial fission process 1 [Micractinium conductrix]|uniref:Mitochondrial fission process protein 1 n=1 Tax=Micractinium conductrix TaxID=554055 RepID=A0A2P6VNV0_9CHLO|nr:mitochondrial fission process 1 [Micractinium conductrix]|eukprot:PSC75737.1 mitochondrial fission process 1 [Micractinium conductrix]
MSSAPREPQGAAPAAADPLRDSWLRYIAFTSDLGEAFKAQLSRRLYLGSYAVVALYGVLDAADKGAKAAARNAQPAPCAPPHGAGAALPLPAAAAACAGRLAAAAAARLPAPPAHLYTANSANEAASIPVAVPVAAAVLDTALWHAAASLAIPAALINRTVWAARALAARPSAVAALHPRLRQLAPPLAGLAMIPLAVHRIDEAVTEWMDAHFRPHLPASAVPPIAKQHHH